MSAADLTAALVLPFVLSGVINRVKALWSGRRGPPILQLAYDTGKLLRKTPVYSATATPLFRVAPWVLVATSLASLAIVPVLGAAPLASFPFDFVWFAYVWAIGRVALMLAALDTGSSFEGMGAAREATFSTLLEPVLFLVAGALCLSAHTTSLSEALAQRFAGGAQLLLAGAALLALLIVLQVETARIPVDDPNTHLELTMIHEVMVLDHSGPDLAAIQLSAALKLTIGASMIATLLNPWAGAPGPACAAANVALSIGVAVLVGTVESLMARFALRAVPRYIAVGLGSGGIALLLTAIEVSR